MPEKHEYALQWKQFQIVQNFACDLLQVISHILQIMLWTVIEQCIKCYLEDLFKVPTPSSLTSQNFWMSSRMCPSLFFMDAIELIATMSRGDGNWRNELLPSFGPSTLGFLSFTARVSSHPQKEHRENLLRNLLQLSICPTFCV